jgi:hypothetical protein
MMLRAHYLPFPSVIAHLAHTLPPQSSLHCTKVSKLQFVDRPIRRIQLTGYTRAVK